MPRRDAVLDGSPTFAGRRRLELGRGGRERPRDPAARARAPRPRRPRRCGLGRLRETLPRALDRVLSIGARLTWPSDADQRARLRAAAGADRAAAARAARRVAAARLRPARAARCGTGASASCPTSCGGELVVVNDTRVVPARDPDSSGRGGEVLLLERLDDGALGGARAADAAAARGERYGPVELLEHARRGPLAVAAPRRARRARCRCRRTSASRSTIRSATRPSTRASPARPRRRPPGCTSRRSCSAALDVERVTLHVGLDTFRPVAVDELERARAARRALRGAPGGVGADPRGRARARRRHDDRARARDARARRAARRPHDAVRHARLRVPARGRAADELPPAALDAARARDGVRRRRARRAALPARPSRSGTASTPSAMRC